MEPLGYTEWVPYPTQCACLSKHLRARGVIGSGKPLYPCREFTSTYEFSMYLLDETTAVHLLPNEPVGMFAQTGQLPYQGSFPSSSQLDYARSEVSSLCRDRAENDRSRQSAQGRGELVIDPRWSRLVADPLHYDLPWGRGWASWPRVLDGWEPPEQIITEAVLHPTHPREDEDQTLDPSSPPPLLADLAPISPSLEQDEGNLADHT